VNPGRGFYAQTNNDAIEEDWWAPYTPDELRRTRTRGVTVTFRNYARVKWNLFCRV
jgi:hypothetical protein